MPEEMVKEMMRKIEKKGTLLSAIFTKKLTAWLVILLSISLIPTVIPVVRNVPASMVTWYVATTGSDAAAGDISHPFKTIQHAVDVAQAGHTIYVRGGTYNERIVMKKSGTSGYPITISSATDEVAIIDGTNKASENGLIYLNGKDYITFNYLKIQNSETHGLYTGWLSGTNPSTDITVTNCQFEHIGRYGILFYASDQTYPCYRMKVTHCNFNDINYLRTGEECVGFGKCVNSEFSYNKMTKLGKIGFDFGACKNSVAHHNDIDVTDMHTSAYGIYVIAGNAQSDPYTSTGIKIYDNYVHGNRQCIGFANERTNCIIKDVTIENNVVVVSGGYEGIHQFYRSADSPNYFENIKIIHNTIYATGGSGCIYLDAPSSVMNGIVVANNILWSTSASQYKGPSGVILANNLNWGSTTGNAGTLRGDPKFVSVGSDFHIQSGSAARDAGSPTYKTTDNTDFDGKDRTSANDIGAYEYEGQISENSDSSSPPDSASPAPIPPVISQVSITHSSTERIVAGYGWENITCVVTDTDEVSTVLVRLTNPDKSTTNVPMIKKIGTTTYYANQSLHQKGAYSYHIQATDSTNNVALSSSHTFWLQPDWDINSDGIVTITDLLLVSNHYGETGFKGWIREDVDHNGVIQALDIATVSSHYDRSWWS